MWSKLKKGLKKAWRVVKAVVRAVVRVAVTLEQCWHRVPGGTATAALGLVAALAGRDDVDVVGVAARHGDGPPPAFAPSVPVQHLPVPRRVLYETWHTRWPWPAVQQADQFICPSEKSPNHLPICYNTPDSARGLPRGKPTASGGGRDSGW